MRLLVVVIVTLVLTGCKSTGHKCDAYESRPVVKKKK